MIDYHRAFIVGLFLAASRSNSQTLAADGCPENQCRDPEGKCAGEANCYFDPCQDACSEDEVCRVIYCGECYPVCELENLPNQQSSQPSPRPSNQPSSKPTPQPSAASVLSTTKPSLSIAVINSTEHQSFADKLTAILYTKDNECSSALGVSMALSLIYPGCTGDVIDPGSTGDAIYQIRDTLGYPGGSMQLVWEETTQRMLSNSGGQCVGGGVCNSAAPLLQIANSVWFDDNDTLNEEYESVVGNYAMQIDFQADDSPVIVNDWVNDSTNGMIESIVPEDTPLSPYVLIAINSIYLKARWQEQFKESKTNLDSFYGSSSRTSQVSEAHFMNTVDYFDYSHKALPGYQVIDLPFAESKMSMIFVLPMSDDSETILSIELLSILDNLQSTRVALSVPKFKFESEYDDNLKEALMQLGIEAPFTEGSGALCGIFEDDKDCEKIVIDKVVQKTVIDVNEEGVEAAAVTAIMMMPTSIEPEDTNDSILMILDHPFQFFIYDKLENLMLFEGRLGAPGIPQTKPEVALLDSVHSDSDFWSNAFYVNPVAPLVIEDPAGTTADGCPKDQCRDPEGNCAGEVNCFADPCEVQQGCGGDEVCTANYCGGCNAVCEPGNLPSQQSSQPSSKPTNQPSVATGSPTTQPSLSIAVINSTEHRGFADELTAILYTKDNECSSALGVSMAFSLIYPGCTGDAISQIRDVLGYPTGSNMQLVWNETTQRMLGNSRGQCIGGVYNGVCELEAPLLQIANSVWFDDGDTLNQDYDLVVGSYAKQINFQADDSPIIVNEWVKNSTNGLIESIVPEDTPLYPPYVLIAINSIYLKAAWKDQFEEHKTNLDSFYGSASRTIEVTEAHFMNTVEYFDYSHEAIPGYQVVQLPFASSQMSMIFVLPMNDNVGTVTSTDLLEALSDFQSTRVALSVPKFKFESEYDDSLKAALIQTGIVAPFSGGSLCGLFEANSCALFVDKVIQKTVIDVNEEGVEAAAVTAIMISESASPEDTNDPILMILDHPFQFFIYDKSEDLVLFEGRLGAPKVPETEPGVALLDAVHSDSDFWSNAFYVNPVDPSATTDEPEPQPSQSSHPSSNPTPQPSNASDSASTRPTDSTASPSDSPTTAGTLSTSPTTSPTTLSNPPTPPTEPLAASPTSSPTKNPVTSDPTDTPSVTSASFSSQPTNSSDLSTSEPTKASDSSTTQPSAASGSSTSQPTKASGSSTSEPTEASGSPSTQPSVASGSQPSEASGFSSPQFDGISDTSSGKRPASNYFSLCTCILLAFAFGFVH